MAPDGTILDNSDQHVAVSLLPRAQAVGRYIFDAFPGDPQSQTDLLASHEAVRRTSSCEAARSRWLSGAEGKAAKILRPNACSRGSSDTCTCWSELSRMVPSGVISR